MRRAVYLVLTGLVSSPASADIVIPKKLECLALNRSDTNLDDAAIPTGKMNFETPGIKFVKYHFDTETGLTETFLRKDGAKGKPPEYKPNGKNSSTVDRRKQFSPKFVYVGLVGRYSNTLLVIGADGVPTTYQRVSWDFMQEFSTGTCKPIP